MNDESSAQLGDKATKARHIILTTRDIEMMASLHEGVVMSFRQIQNRFFLGKSHATTHNRLKAIEGQGLITRTRIPRLKISGQLGQIGVVFQLSPKGRLRLSQERSELEIFEKCPHLSPHQLDHDLLVNDIAEFFKEQMPGAKWINGRYLNDQAGLKKIPDALLIDSTANRVTAIELELTVKSMVRYKEIVANLKASREIHDVIFVTSSVSIGRKIMSAIEGYAVPSGHRFRSNFFRFMRLSDCLAPPQSTDNCEEAIEAHGSAIEIPGQT